MNDFDYEPEQELPKVKKDDTQFIRKDKPNVPQLVDRVREYNMMMHLPYKPTDAAELRELQKLERKGFLTYTDGYIVNAFKR